MMPSWQRVGRQRALRAARSIFDRGGGIGSTGGLSGIDYFSWSCESDTTSLGPVVQYFGGTPAGSSTTRMLLNGDGVMRLVVVGNDAGNQQLGAEVGLNQLIQNGSNMLFVGGPAIYYRWYMRIEPGFSWGAGTAKTKSSRTGGGPIVNSSTAQGYTGYLMSNGFLIGECGSAGCTVPGGGANTDGNHLISYDFRTKNDGLWREYIVMVKPNSGAAVADAQFQAWVDNVAIGGANNYILHASAIETFVEMWGGWMVMPYFQLNGTASDGGTIYCRDFLVSNYYNSLLD